MHLFQSLLLHLLLMGILLVAIHFGPSRVEGMHSIALENISLNKPVKTINSETDEASKVQINTSAPTGATSPESLPGQTQENISPSLIQNYLQEISNRINRVKKYPEAARMNEQEGVVEVMLEVAPSGEVLRSEIKKSSTFDSLDHAALSAIQGIGTLPPFPASKPIQLRVPIQFQLQ